MSSYFRHSIRMAGLVIVVTMASLSSAIAATVWSGTLRDDAGNPAGGAIVKLHQIGTAVRVEAKTLPSGQFTLGELPAGDYELSATWNGKAWTKAGPLVIKEGTTLAMGLRLSASQEIQVEPASSGATAAPQASGGEHLSSGEVSSLPLNERDFSKLLLLAAGTMTDANGAANFTQQFAVNGQRGAATVFAIDGVDTTDPEMGGATFSNFNVDAIQEVQSNSGVMPAEIGHGAASYTNVISKSGTNHVHGSFFEFARNAAFDARNFFDRRSLADDRRIPPFIRNEFGFAIGGPVTLPGRAHGDHRTFFFGQYQGFRQVLGTTQVFAVPTAAERQGVDTASVPGDTLMVPVNPEIAPVLARYPLPNDPQGAFGARTYATSSKVSTHTDQFSVRFDHRVSDKSALFARFSLNQITGPLTNPNQTAIDPSFAIQYFDHQRNAGFRYSRTFSPHLSSETMLGYIRSTPFFPSINQTQPALSFGDGLFEAFNAADGSVIGSFGNLYQFKHDMVYNHGAHTFKWGVEMRFNRDATIFGTNPNGSYAFGGGAAYSTVLIPSASGSHDIQPGDPLPDSLTGLLTATPYSYTISVASAFTAQGDRFDEAAVRREAYNFYFQDTWKVSPHLAVNAGLRYEVNSPTKEARKRTSGPVFLGPDGKSATYWAPGTQEIYVNSPQPPYATDWNGWGPRLSLDYGVGDHTVLHVAGAINTILPNLWQDNFVTGGIPYAFPLFATALPGTPLPFQNAVVPVTLPDVYTPEGELVFATGNTATAPANTPMDLQRFQNDLAALTPGHQIQLIGASGIVTNFRNGYIETYTAGLDHDFGDIKFSAAYVATMGVHLASVLSPNSYGGADPAFAPFTQFDSAGRPIGGYGAEALMNTRSHSTYHALQTSLSKNSVRGGLGFQASYTFSKSIDDTSAVLGGFFGNAGVVLQTFPQDPWNPGAEKGPSTFDATHTFSMSAIQVLPLDRVSFLRPLGRPLTSGWQFLCVASLSTGSPFTVFSGVQQTGVGAGGTDRPDMLAHPVFSTGRTVREDYFGRGADNASFFNIPINVQGGTGPNHGRFGTLGRDTFRGPGFRNFDIALIKNTAFGHRGNGELAVLQIRAEFFNVFNLVNLGLPSNVVRGSGFGLISKTAGPSRQIQFSLKLNY
jgi:Carboxypeptidase regulatory-like domain